MSCPAKDCFMQALFRHTGKTGKPQMQAMNL